VNPTQASQAAAEAAHCSEAHEALEPVRLRRMPAREQSGIGHYPDLLTAFHEPMEAIVLAAKDQTPARFGARQRGEIDTNLADAPARWHRVNRRRSKPSPLHTWPAPTVGPARRPCSSTPATE